MEETEGLPWGLNFVAVPEEWLHRRMAIELCVDFPRRVDCSLQYDGRLVFACGRFAVKEGTPRR